MRRGTCTNCAWFNGPNRAGEGECRFNAPQAVAVFPSRLSADDGHVEARWPLMGGDDWCGQHTTRQDR